MAKMNWLTRGTRAEWSGVDRSVKDGDSDRAIKRAAEWAVWRAGLDLPDGAKLTMLDDGRYQFAVEHIHSRGHYDRQRRARRYNAVPPVVTYDPVTAPFTIPPWAEACRYADRWHEAHQMGADFVACHQVGMGYDSLDRIMAPEQMELTA